MIRITEIGDQDKHLWQELVFSHPEATCFHLYDWKLAIEKAYNLSTLYLGAFENNKLIAVLPTVVIKRPFSAKRAVSLAFCSYAGLLAKSSAHPKEEITSAFFYHLKNKGVTELEIRQRRLNDQKPSEELTQRRTLPLSSEVLWEELDGKVRNQIRKAMKSGLVVQWGDDQLDEFYSIYAANMKFLGSPVHSKELFRKVLIELPCFAELLILRLHGKPIAGLLAIGFRDELTDLWASSLREYNELCPNMLLYWEAMRYGIEKGFKFFDMGRSHFHSGTYRFKRQWGTEAIPLSYEVYSNSGIHTDSSVTQYRTPQARMFASLWRRLPFRLTLAIGPMARKFLP